MKKSNKLKESENKENIIPPFFPHVKYSILKEKFSKIPIFYVRKEDGGYCHDTLFLDYESAYNYFVKLKDGHIQDDRFEILREEIACSE